MVKTTDRGMDDRQLIAASELAKRNEIWDRAINTADRTREMHDFSMRYLAPYRDVMKNYVSQQQLDEAWVYGLIRQESRFIPDVKSSAGAVGLMQLMPATARELGVNPLVPEQNIEGGVRYFSQLLRMFGGLELALVAYNAGPGFAQRYARGPQPGITRDRCDTSVAEADDKRLQTRRGERLGKLPTRGATKRKPGGLIPRERLGSDVLEIATFPEELVEERLQRGHEDRRSFPTSLSLLFLGELIAAQ